MVPCVPESSVVVRLAHGMARRLIAMPCGVGATCDSYPMQRLASQARHNTATMTVSAARSALGVVGHSPRASLGSRLGPHWPAALPFASPVHLTCAPQVAVAHALAAHPGTVRRVALVDWDVHHGNGTQHMFEDDPQVGGGVLAC